MGSTWEVSQRPGHRLLRLSSHSHAEITSVTLQRGMSPQGEAARLPDGARVRVELPERRISDGARWRAGPDRGSHSLGFLSYCRCNGPEGRRGPVRWGRVRSRRHCPFCGSARRKGADRGAFPSRGPSASACSLELESRFRSARAPPGSAAAEEPTPCASARRVLSDAKGEE